MLNDLCSLKIRIEKDTCSWSVVFVMFCHRVGAQGVSEVLYKRIIICVYVYWRVCLLPVRVGDEHMIVTI